MDAGRGLTLLLPLASCAAGEDPTLVLVSPEPGTSLPGGERVTLCLEVVDDDPVELITATVRWREVEVQRALLDAADCPGGNATVGARLDEGTGVLAVDLLDGNGGTAHAQAWVEVVANEPPRCRIQLPETDSTWAAGATVPVQAVVEDDALDPATVEGVLQSNIDGVWWQGSPDEYGQITVYHPDTARGTHVLSLAVTDPVGQSDTCTRSFLVE